MADEKRVSDGGVEKKALIVTPVGAGDASAANQTAVQADPGSDATKAVSVQGITGGKAVPISAAALPLPTGAATAAGLTTINTTLGSPFQAGGSIGNTAFGATQSGSWLTGVKGADGSNIVSSSNGLYVIGTKLNDGSQSSTGGTHLTMGGVDTGTNVYRPMLVDSSGRALIAGSVAHDAVDSGNPIKIGGYATSTSSPTAVAVGDRVNARYSLTGNAVVGTPSIAASGADGTSNNIQTFGDAFDATLKLQVRPEMFNGSTWDRLRGDTNGLVAQPHALTGSRWGYAGVTGGITDTSDVVLAAAGGASVRNYVVALQYHNTSAVASEIVVKDGSTVIWRGYAPATMTRPVDIVFPVPLKGTANTAMNVAMITTATATIVSAQGFTGT
jgi:hypothetical protein